MKHGQSRRKLRDKLNDIFLKLQVNDHETFSEERMWCVAAESSCETENFKSFLLDVNEVRRLRGERKFAERVFPSLSQRHRCKWPKRNFLSLSTQAAHIKLDLNINPLAASLINVRPSSVDCR